eukprot:TRINITY_DN27139_c0_g1_i1.p1 TRINITY_DN27139_c0_g1~~TRINITY_DN27139_c0_g1_i1.p1  ORF type:complete len:610 (-),score=59.32 TRINITY_DN27139_c0_g1_i1:26-1825(-)
MDAVGSLLLPGVRSQLALVKLQQEASLANLVRLLQNPELCLDTAHDPALSCKLSCDFPEPSESQLCEGNSASYRNLSANQGVPASDIIWEEDEAATHDVSTAEVSSRNVHIVEPCEQKDIISNETPPQRVQLRASELIRRAIGNVIHVASASSEWSQWSRSSCFQSLHACCHKTIRDPRFEMLMGCIIFLNAIIIGIDTQSALDRDGAEFNWSWTDVADLICLGIYIIEMSLRLLAEGRPSFQDSWFIFDSSLVALGFLGTVLLPTLSVWRGLSADVEPFRLVFVLRTLRILRLFKALRTVPWFRTAWRLIYGLLTSGNAIASTLALLLLVLFMFACLAAEVISQDPHLRTHPTTRVIIDQHFSSLPRITLTLFSFVCADSVTTVYTPIILERPVLSLYFVLLILVVSVSLMNLVTAALVEGALRHANQDEELFKADLQRKLKSVLPGLLHTFRDHDVDGNGTLSREEMKNMSVKHLPKDLWALVQQAGFASLDELFDVMDTSGDNEVSYDEFVEGLLNLLTMPMSLTSFRTFRKLEELRVSLMEIHGRDRLPSAASLSTVEGQTSVQLAADWHSLSLERRCIVETASHANHRRQRRNL